MVMVLVLVVMVVMMVKVPLPYLCPLESTQNHCPSIKYVSVAEGREVRNSMRIHSIIVGKAPCLKHEASLAHCLCSLRAGRAQKVGQLTNPKPACSDTLPPSESFL